MNSSSNRIAVTKDRFSAGDLCPEGYASGLLKECLDLLDTHLFEEGGSKKIIPL